MKLQQKIVFLLPIVIFFVLFSSIFFSETIQNQKNTTQVRKNPSPENIQVLGVQNQPDEKKDSQSQQTEKESATFNAETLYRLINSYRKENHLNLLSIHKSLEESAQRKLADMIEHEYFRHADTQNTESWYLFQAAGYQYSFAGENLSSGINTPWQVFEAWQESPTHNEQLLKQDYLDMGIAFDCETYKIRNKPSCIVVLHLGAQ